MGNQWKHKTFADRFWEKVDITDTCWNWTARTNDDGYGEMIVRKDKLRAHRISHALHYGPIPEGKQVLHSCDNPACVRPDHLFIGSHSDNMRDRLLKNRCASKLTEDNVNEIREHYDYGEFTGKEIAKYYGVSAGLISMVVNYKIWSHL